MSNRLAMKDNCEPNSCREHVDQQKLRFATCLTGETGSKAQQGAHQHKPGERASSRGKRGRSKRWS
eukprot:3027607-Pyramimonas_sp.AAC.1